MTDFYEVTMFFTLLYKAEFTHANFEEAILSGVNATQTVFGTRDSLSVDLANNSFVGSIIWNPSFHLAFLKGSLWDKVKINYTSFTAADMSHVTFTDSECHYCLFNLTQLTDTNFHNSSLDGSDFTRANVIYEQLVVTRSFQGVISPNGNIIH
jgi:uncharacterized protein YjbI with pentapeptide repeats